jgi:hypothetical protein
MFVPGAGGAPGYAIDPISGARVRVR